MTVPRSGTDPLLRDLDQLRPLLAGELVLPDEAQWADACRVWNTHVRIDPLAVAYPLTTDDIQRLLGLATAQGVAVSVVANGHGATPALDGTIVLRTEKMAGVTVDLDGRTARIEAGARWHHVMDALRDTGLMALPGSTPDIAVVPYLLGGGLPWLARSHGFAADHVRRFEVVTCAGEHLDVSADTSPELFWALRGGGGDMAIVTAAEIALLDEPPIYGGELMWPAEHTAEVLAAFADATEQAPPELTMWLWLTTFPPVEPIPTALQGQSFANLNVTYLGGRAEAESALQAMREVPGLTRDTLRELGAADLGEITGEPTEPMPAMDWSRTTPALSNDLQHRLLEVNWPGPHTPVIVCIRHLGGALCHQIDGAVPAIPDDYLLLGFGVPFTDDDAHTIAAHFRLLEDTLDEHISDRSTYTMLGQRSDISNLFDAATLTRLREIKALVDTDGTLRSNRPLGG